MSARELTMLDAVREGIDEAMGADERVIVLGEDIAGGAGLGDPYEGVMGGTFGATKGLLEKYGPRRVRDTPISEAGFVGTAVGAAAAGLRPIVDLMWSDFALLAFDQIVNQASKMRYMFGGQASVPLVLRMAMGAGLSAGGQHSDTLYSLFTHIPGLKVVVPSNGHDAKGLLLEAVQDDDPVVIFEHMRLYPRKGPVPEGPYRVPFGAARALRLGEDVTVVAIAAMVERAEEAAVLLADEGIELEVIDPRTLSPLDGGTILDSVRRTGRLVVVDESPPRCSVAADIAGLVAQHAPRSLKSGVRLVTSPHSPVPFSPPLEAAYVPSVEAVVEAARQVLKPA
ncbi:MAG TPA: alpha-ketoacid dehydrogenase subunit beta [Acidimicrobiales bacterium]|nr:alpha-ketoacid dehydrogenase subunit beta [Acidimicrobiales bacterium]